MVVSLLVCNSRPFFFFNAFLLDLRAGGNKTLPGSLMERTSICLQQFLPLVCAGQIRAGVWDREQAAGLALRHSLLVSRAVSASMLRERKWRRAGFN